ncbi:gephyrin-like molybdotransferase Glp [Aestuariibius insulae]|uniref:molybdopterin molybdotransferase MoeA n=1 Tax=Aestuariibius insulae TaxID=2058287 RepID=UPI00345E3119
MISVDEALEHIFALSTPTNTETIPLTEAQGRVLAQDVTALRAQPPFAGSAMDGYAVRSADVSAGGTLTVIGEAAAGRRFDKPVGQGQAVRIFTGAPVPDGADRILIQEDTDRDGDTLHLHDDLDAGPYIRPAGSDFPADFTLSTPRRLGPNDIALLASMGAGQIVTYRPPTVAILATGDELVAPGERPGPDQIMASNSYGLHAMFRAAGAHPRLLPIARDTAASLSTAFDLAASADLIVTIGGASVGDYDLVRPVAGARGMEPSFYKVAMRPGKPLMAGRIDSTPIIGLPGNPVSAMVCGRIFVLPLLDAMQGLSAKPAARLNIPLAAPLPANGPREHYMRAVMADGVVTAFDRQDSSLLNVLHRSNALVVRPPNAPKANTGTPVPVVPL